MAKKAKNGNSTDGRVCCFAVESEELCGNRGRGDGGRGGGGGGGWVGGQ